MLGRPVQVGGGSVKVPEVPLGKLPACASARLPVSAAAPTSPIVSAAKLAAAALASRKADSSIGGRRAGTGATSAPIVGGSPGQLPSSPAAAPASLPGPDQAPLELLRTVFLQHVASPCLVVTALDAQEPAPNGVGTWGSTANDKVEEDEEKLVPQDASMVFDSTLVPTTQLAANG